MPNDCGDAAFGIRNSKVRAPVSLTASAGIDAAYVLLPITCQSATFFPLAYTSIGCAGNSGSLVNGRSVIRSLSGCEGGRPLKLSTAELPSVQVCRSSVLLQPDVRNRSESPPLPNLIKVPTSYRVVLGSRYTSTAPKLRTISRGRWVNA